MSDVLKGINSVNWKSGTTIYKIGDEADFAYLLEKERQKFYQRTQ